MTTYARVIRAWTGEGWVDDAVVSIDDDHIAVVPTEPDEPVGRIDDTLLPPVTDAHVHIGLSDFATRGAGALARLLDLGWDPPALSAVVASSPSPAPEVRWAGTFLTAPGGYPSTRAWAPPGSVTPVATPEQAVAAVDAQRGLGAAVIKVTLNADAGPVLPDDVLRAVVDRAHEHGLVVVAHVEGAGQPMRAVEAGVDWFAHAPWTHRLSDAELDAMVGRVGWIGTLDIHGRGDYGDDYARALDNVSRFVARGGPVAYGTDLGNALTTADVNPREVAALRSAGVDGERLLAAVTGAGLLPRWSRTASLLPADVTGTADALDALAQARPVDAATLRAMVG
ncbi:MAG: amidohydrolase [Micromonosporaceae bacterium]|nr:amidohydrolase [Micromonosporaceae bacterium]